MKPITRRLQRLETWASRQRNEDGETPVDVLRRRIRACAEADGVSYEDLPAMPSSSHRGRALTVAQVLFGR